ncbi:hypothetical protein ACIP9C_19570 [Lysinibacillus sp. NPDC093210]
MASGGNAFAAGPTEHNNFEVEENEHGRFYGYGDERDFFNRLNLITL